MFFFSREDYVVGSSDGILKHFYVDGSGEMTTTYYYDPLTVEGNEEATNMNLMTLTLSELERYNIAKRNRLFNEHYKKATGRDYISMFPRKKPRYFMWPADFFGQEHWVTTKETHFETNPPQNEIAEINMSREKRVLAENEVSSELLADFCYHI